MTQVLQEQGTKVRLDVAALRKHLAKLGLDVSFYRPGSEEVEGLDPGGVFCQQMSHTGGHCQVFLRRLARESIAQATVRCGSCLPGAFTVVAGASEARAETPVVLGCFVSKSLRASEELMRAASRGQLDHEALVQSACREAKYREGDVEVLAKVLAEIVEDTYKRSSEQANEVESLCQNLAETYEELSFIYKLNNAMNVTANPEEYFRQVAENLCKLLGVKAVLVALFPESLSSGAKKNIVIHYGTLPVSEEQIMKRAYPEMLDKGGCLVRGDRRHCPTYAAEDKELGELLLAPILRGERQLGMIMALGPREGRQFDNIDAARLSSVANSAAVFLENFRLYGSLRVLFLGSVRALTSSIDAKDPYTCGHSERVAVLSKKLVELMGLPGGEAERIYLCGLLHDIGKIGVPEAVLRKPGKLTGYEFELIKQHPVIGAKIVRGIQEMEDLIPGVLHHHERMDGQGYPKGLGGEEIPFRARVLCMADALDAMTSDRPYRKALPAKLAEGEVFRAAGTQFDPALVEVVLKLNFPEYIAELRTHKGVHLPEDIYEPLVPMAE